MADTAIALAADLREIVRLNAWLASHFDAQDEVFQRLKLCLNEAVENVIRYGNGPSGSREIHVRLGTRDGCAEFELSDNGRAYDPLKRQARQKYADLATAEIGGFGIDLMRDMATELAYRRTSGRNILSARFCAENAPAA